MFKYIKLLGAWKDVSKIYKEEKGTDKPWWVSRRLFGAIFIFIGLFLYVVFDIKTSPEQINQMADNVTDIADNIEKIIPAIIALYGFITSIVGTLKRQKKDANTK